MTWQLTILAPLVAFAMSYAVVRWLLAGRTRKIGLDHPNERSLHTRPVPRLGGAGIFAGTFVGWLLVRPGAVAVVPLPIWIGTVLLVGISLREDLRGVSMRWRILAHFAAAVAFVGTSFDGALPWWLFAPTVLGTIWVTNLYNFMDGSDGLAAGMAVFGFGAYGVAAWLAGDVPFAAANACLATAAAGFLCFNFSPAKIFMGDVGAIPLGFLAAALGGLGWCRGTWSLWLPFVVFSPFMVDATVTLLARQLRGEKVWQPHRTHYYQRLVLMGWGHRRVALAEYGLMAACAATAVATSGGPWFTHLAVASAWVVLYAATMLMIDRRWSHFQRQASSA